MDECPNDESNGYGSHNTTHPLPCSARACQCLAALRKDAERWRWYITPGELQQQCRRLKGEMLVAAVDTHMAAERAAG